MGIDIVPLAYKHKLDISSPEAFAKDISERFSANVVMEEENKNNDYHRIEMFQIRNANATQDISIRMSHPSDEDKMLYEVSFGMEHKGSFEVYPYHVDMYLTESPFRWHGFEECIWYKDEPVYRNTLIEYREYIKNLSNLMGCTKCLYIPDQGYTGYIWGEAQKGVDYDSLIDYIRKRIYLKECKDKERLEKSLLLNLPCFLSKTKDYDGYPDVYLDVVMDDFHHSIPQV